MRRVVNTRNQSVLVSDLELANTLKTRLVGLMMRPQLENGKGLWIYRSGNSIHTFFMKFAIDLAFVNSKGVVKHLRKTVKPWRIVVAPLILPTDCLELPAGTITKTDTRVGDTLRVES